MKGGCIRGLNGFRIIFYLLHRDYMTVRAKNCFAGVNIRQNNLILDKLTEGARS